MLLTFPYHGNYTDLIRMELNALAYVRPADFVLRKFAIIGSGPLPLTSLCISSHLNRGNERIRYCNIYHNATAITSSRSLCRALGHSEESMTFQCAEADSADIDLGSFDVVYLAALVGQCTDHKHKIMASVVKRMRPGALVVLRSAHCT